MLTERRRWDAALRHIIRFPPMNSTTPLPLALVSGEYSRLRSVEGMTARRRENDDDDDDDKDDVVEERSSHVEIGPPCSTGFGYIVLVACHVGIIARTLELRSDTHIPGADLPSHAHSDTYIPCTDSNACNGHNGRSLGTTVNTRRGATTGSWENDPFT